MLRAAGLQPPVSSRSAAKIRRGGPQVEAQRRSAVADLKPLQGDWPVRHSLGEGGVTRSLGDSVTKGRRHEGNGPERLRIYHGGSSGVARGEVGSRRRSRIADLSAEALAKAD